MESDEMGIQELLAATGRVFTQCGDRVTITKYKKVLEAIGVYPENRDQLQDFFDSVDQDGDGYITFEDFQL